MYYAHVGGKSFNSSTEGSLQMRKKKKLERRQKSSHILLCASVLWLIVSVLFSLDSVAFFLHIQSNLMETNPQWNTGMWCKYQLISAIVNQVISYFKYVSNTRNWTLYCNVSLLCSLVTHCIIFVLVYKYSQHLRNLTPHLYCSKSKVCHDIKHNCIVINVYYFIPCEI